MFVCSWLALGHLWQYLSRKKVKSFASGWFQFSRIDGRASKRSLSTDYRSLDLCWIVYTDGIDGHIPEITVDDSVMEITTSGICNDFVAVYKGKAKPAL